MFLAVLQVNEMYGGGSSSEYSRENVAAAVAAGASMHGSCRIFLLLVVFYFAFGSIHASL